MHIFIFVLAK